MASNRKKGHSRLLNSIRISLVHSTHFKWLVCVNVLKNCLVHSDMSKNRAVNNILPSDLFHFNLLLGHILSAVCLFN